MIGLRTTVPILLPNAVNFHPARPALASWSGNLASCTSSASARLTVRASSVLTVVSGSLVEVINATPCDAATTVVSSSRAFPGLMGLAIIKSQYRQSYW